MKVLMANRNPSSWIGGDAIKQQKVTEELIKLGIEVGTLNADEMTLDDWNEIGKWDIVHAWNFSMSWVKLPLYAAFKMGKKMVSTMIYHDTDRFVTYEMQQEFMNRMDACIYETESEVDRVRHHLKERNTFVVPNGVDAWWFEEDKGKVPFKRYVLTVGRIEPNKGQLETAEACRDLGITYVCIGSEVDREYTDQLLAQGAVIYPPMEQKKLKRWYKNCAVYVQASKNETWGMAVDEAGTQGVPIVISTGFERNDIPDVIYCDHGNPDSITHSILEGISQKRNEGFKLQLRKRSWAHVAKAYQKIYKEII